MNITPYFENIREEILNTLQSSNDSYFIAVAWFTDKALFNMLLEKLDAKCEVHIIIRNDAINFNSNSLNWNLFLEKGGILYTLKEEMLLHHKFAIIAPFTLITGSYNWTYFAAKRNRENILIIKEEKQTIIENYFNEFEYLKKHSNKLTQIPNWEKNNVKNAEILYYLEEDATCAIETEQTEQSIEKAIELYNEGRLLYNNLEYDKAILVLQKALQADSNIDYIIDKLVWCYIRVLENKYDNQKIVKEGYDDDYFKKGIALLEESADQYNDKGEYFNALGCLHNSIKNYSQAVKYINRALEYQPESNTYNWNLRNFYIRLGSQTKCDNIDTKLNTINSEYIKKNEHKLEEGDRILMRAYYQRAFLNTNNFQKKKYLIKAKKAYHFLPSDKRDKHDYNEINEEYLGLPEAMKQEFDEA